MEKDLAEGKLGDKGEYGVKLEGMSLHAQAEIAAGPLKGKLNVALDAEPVIDLIAAKMKELIPGKIDDMLLDEAVAMLKAKLKG